MIETNCMQFVIRKKMAEEKIITALNSLFGFLVDTADFNVPGAVGVAQILDYSEGFAQSCLVSWPRKYKPELNQEETAKALANKLGVDVMVDLDLDDEESQWLLAQPHLPSRKVDVVHLSDGVDIKQ